MRRFLVENIKKGTSNKELRTELSMSQLQYIILKMTFTVKNVAKKS